MRIECRLCGRDCARIFSVAFRTYDDLDCLRRISKSCALATRSRCAEKREKRIHPRSIVTSGLVARTHVIRSVPRTSGNQKVSHVHSPVVFTTFRLDSDRPRVTGHPGPDIHRASDFPSPPLACIPVCLSLSDGFLLRALKSVFLHLYLTS